MHKQMRTTRAMRYRTRMLVAGDDVMMSGPDARLYRTMGWVESAGRKKVLVEDIPQLRAAYQEKFGKRPFHGWDAATLREKLNG